MRIKTELKEDEIQLTLTVSELVWLQVLLDSIIHNDNLDGWKEEIIKLHSILREIKQEGQRIKPTSPEFEKADLKWKN